MTAPYQRRNAGHNDGRKSTADRNNDQHEHTDESAGTAGLNVIELDSLLKDDLLTLHNSPGALNNLK